MTNLTEEMVEGAEMRMTGNEIWAWKRLPHGSGVIHCETGRRYFLSHDSQRRLQPMCEAKDGAGRCYADGLPRGQYRLADQPAEPPETPTVPIEEALALCDGWTALHEAFLNCRREMQECLSGIHKCLASAHLALSASAPGAKRDELLRRQRAHAELAEENK